MSTCGRSRAVEKQMRRRPDIDDIDGGATVRLWPLTTVTLSDVSVYDPATRSERLRAETIRAELSLRGLLARARASANSASSGRS